jgi:hypothetical protein
MSTATKICKKYTAFGNQLHCGVLGNIGKE